MKEQALAIAQLALLEPERLEIYAELPSRPENNITLVVGPVEVYLPLSDLVDTAEERSRLEKDLAELNGQILRLESLLSGPFAQKAPPPVVQKERDKLESYRETAGKLQAQLEALN